MQGKSDLIRVKRKPLFFVLFILILAIATPVLADYLGPNRTVTETTSVCKVVLYECKYVAAKDQWKYKRVDDWSCSNEGKPWQAYDNYDGDCGLFSDGRTQWGKVETLQTVTTTHPEAMIISALQGCNLNNGWCNTASELSLNGTEPLSGYTILAVEGSLNGQTFACSGDNCAVPLNEGNNDFTFWALSSWGDSSQLETLSAKVDTIPPTRGLDIVATSGANDWYVSPTSLTATGSDATSGLSSVFLFIDSGTWQSSTILNEGVYNIVVQAEDNAGNISSSSTIISVDTTTPTIDVSVNGTTGNNGWYSSSMQVSATANDATSGVALFESSLDGRVYQAYNSPVSFADGYHTVQFRVVDKAGNETETPVQELYVDTIAPAIDLPPEWEVNDTITYKIQDDGSGLSALRIVIEDEDEKFAKVTWDEVVSGNKFKGEITWNGKFKNGTLAPPGEYLVWIKTTDVAGNERIALGKVIVPQPFASFSLIQPSKLSTALPNPPADLFDVEKVSPTTATPSTTFGGSTTPPNSTSVQSLTLASGKSSSSATTSSNVLWGATAAALIGWATATALEEKKKRKEQEQAQAAQVQAEADAFNAAQSAKRIAQTQQWKINSWLEGQAILGGYIEEAIKQGASEPEIAELKQTSTTQGLGTAIAKAIKLKQFLHASSLRQRVQIVRSNDAKEPIAPQLQNEELDSATRSYMAWAKLVEEGKFPMANYIAYWNTNRQFFPISTPTATPFNLTGNKAAELALQQFRTNNPNYFRFDYDNDNWGGNDFAGQSNCSNFLSQIWWQAGVRFPQNGNQLWDGSYLARQANGTFPFTNNPIQESLAPWYRTPQQQAYFSQYHGEFRIVYSNLAATPNSLRNNSSFVEIITKHPQIFQPGSGMFFYDGLWSHSAIVVNPLSTLTNYFSPITSPGNSPAIVEQDGKFDYLLSNDYSIKYDEKTGLPIRNPNPERQIRSIDDTTNQNLTQISIVPTSLIYPSAYNLDTALMPNTMTGDGKNCLVVEQGQDNEYSLLYCPALPLGATP